MKTDNSWPEDVGNEIALLDFSISEAKDCFSCDFFDFCDDLGELKYALLQTSDRQYVIYRYKNTPNSGVVLVSENRDLAIPLDQISNFIVEFPFVNGRVTWVKPEGEM